MLQITLILNLVVQFWNGNPLVLDHSSLPCFQLGITNKNILEMDKVHDKDEQSSQNLQS